MPLPPDLRWLDPLLDVLVDEFFERRAHQEAKVDCHNSAESPIEEAVT